jgi:hypothetical protein
MLDILHKKINEIVPINGVSYNEEKQIVVDYVDVPSNEQLEAIEQIKNDWPTEILKYNALKNLENDWTNTVKNGWETPFGWKLGLDTTDVTLLTGAFMLAKEASALGINTPVSIVDTGGTIHSLTLQEMTQLMLQYGQARASLSEQYAIQKAAILNSSTPDDIDTATTTTTTTTTADPNVTTTSTTTPEPIRSSATTTIEPETNNDG